MVSIHTFCQIKHVKTYEVCRQVTKVNRAYEWKKDLSLTDRDILRNNKTLSNYLKQDL